MVTVSIMVVSCTTASLAVALAADKGANESLFLALHFADGNVASIQLSNGENRQREVIVERYSSAGKTLERIKKTVPANEKSEVRLDLSSTASEFGWVRVLTHGKAVTISVTLKMIKEGGLETIPEQATHRHPETQQRLSPLPHKWTFDLVNNLGALAYFVNLSEYPVHVAMCQDQVPGCTNPTLPYAILPMASISFPFDHSRRYAVIESTPGYSAAASLRLTEGTKRYFDASSCIKFEGSTSCAPTPVSPPRSAAPKYVSPIGQSAIENFSGSEELSCCSLAQDR